MLDAAAARSVGAVETVRSDLPKTRAAFACWLSDLRKRSGLSHDQLAQALGLDLLTGRGQTIRWLNGRVQPGGLTLLKILSALGVRIEPAPPEELPGAVNAELAALRREVRELRSELLRLAVALEDGRR